MSAENTDHKAEALRQLEEADDVRCGRVPPGSSPDPERVQQLQAEALVHSNLAIAEGQERVAEEIRRISDLLDLSSNENGFLVQAEVRRA